MCSHQDKLVPSVMIQIVLSAPNSPPSTVKDALVSFLASSDPSNAAALGPNTKPSAWWIAGLSTVGVGSIKRRSRDGKSVEDKMLHIKNR